MPFLITKLTCLDAEFYGGDVVIYMKLRKCHLGKHHYELARCHLP